MFKSWNNSLLSQKKSDYPFCRVNCRKQHDCWRYPKKVSVLVPSGGTVCIDHGLFLTVAENLIGNAARFAEKAISIQITLQNDSMTLNVEDDGAGYPLSLVQNGPTPFETTSSNSSHFGMGLYSSRILCEKHGGRLILENRAGGGASAMAIFHLCNP